MLPSSFQVHEQRTRRLIDRRPLAEVTNQATQIRAAIAAFPACPTAGGRTSAMQDRYDVAVLQHPGVAAQAVTR